MTQREIVAQQTWEMLEAAQAEDDSDQANRRFSQVEQTAREILESRPDDPDACYAIALSWYHRRLPAEQRRPQVYEWLQRARVLAPDHPWVPLYFGYQSFDDGLYQPAFDWFARVDRGYFASLDQGWRNLKTEELMLCCRILDMQHPPVSYRLLRELVSAYLATGEQDQPLPTEIVQVLVKAEYRVRFDVPEPMIASEACRLIEGVGGQRIFEAELEQVRVVSPHSSSDSEQ